MTPVFMSTTMAAAIGGVRELDRFLAAEASSRGAETDARMSTSASSS